jgi:hypothetical protein
MGYKKIKAAQSKLDGPIDENSSLILRRRFQRNPAGLYPPEPRPFSDETLVSRLKMPENAGAATIFCIGRTLFPRLWRGCNNSVTLP